VRSVAASARRSASGLPRKCSVVKRVQQRFGLLGRSSRVVPQIHFSLDQLEVDQALGSLTARGLAEIGQLAILKGRKPDAAVDFALRNHFGAHGDSSAVHDHPGRGGRHQ